MSGSVRISSASTGQGMKGAAMAGPEPRARGTLVRGQTPAARREQVHQPGQVTPCAIGEVSTGQFVRVWGHTSRGSLALESPNQFGTLSLLHSGAKATPATGPRTHSALPALLQWLFLCNRVAGWGHVLSLTQDSEGGAETVSPTSTQVLRVGQALDVGVRGK